VIRPSVNSNNKGGLGFSLPDNSRPFTPSGYGKQKTSKRTSKVDDVKSDATSVLESDLMNSDGSPLKTLKIYN
jgi:hypothetical protein